MWLRLSEKVYPNRQTTTVNQVLSTCGVGPFPRPLNFPQGRKQCINKWLVHPNRQKKLRLCFKTFATVRLSSGLRPRRRETNALLPKKNSHQNCLKKEQWRHFHKYTPMKGLLYPKRQITKAVSKQLCAKYETFLFRRQNHGGQLFRQKTFEEIVQNRGGYRLKKISSL